LIYKTCFKCGVEKPLDDFYAHPQMADGHLGVCKSCKREYQRVRTKTEIGREYERIRNKNPHRRSNRQLNTKKWRQENPERNRAHLAVYRAITNGTLVKPTSCEECGSQLPLHAHHEDYNRPLDVIWLCVNCHGKKNPHFIPLLGYDLDVAR